MITLARRNIFLFPLGTVLFPGGMLPLKIFEQRYLEMTKACIRDNLPFGVCLIREGREVGEPATPETVGCLATIEQWDMPGTGIFHLLARGGERFRILETSVAINGLLSADVELLASAASCVPDPDCVRLDDSAWVAYRIADMMSFPMSAKQEMLGMAAIESVFCEIKRYIKSNT
jgi:Lon protease-like protein